MELMKHMRPVAAHLQPNALARNLILQLFPQGKPHMNQPPCFQSAQMIIRAQQMLWQTFPSSTLADR